MSLTLVRNLGCSTCSTVWALGEVWAENDPKLWLDKGDMRRNTVEWAAWGMGGDGILSLMPRMSFLHLF
jgi:hypothetical protein